jgi:ribosome maturation factor RimP
VKYERVIGRQAHVQTSAEKNWEGVLADCEEQRVVAERRHSDADLRQVVKVHERRRVV